MRLTMSITPRASTGCVSLLSFIPLSILFFYLGWQCYLRLTTRERAQALLEAARIKDIASELELLMGRREEVYWEHVPEKVRALAVRRADVPGVGQGAIEEEEVDTRRPGSASRASGTRRHKRRR